MDLQRLLWAPHTSLDGVVDEYCRTWFGPDAAPEMAAAMYQLEDNLTAPLADSKGVDRYLDLVRGAGGKIPSVVKDRDCLWRSHMQKALLDKYVQLRLRRQETCLEHVKARLATGVDDGED